MDFVGGSEECEFEPAVLLLGEGRATCCGVEGQRPCHCGR